MSHQLRLCPREPDLSSVRPVLAWRWPDRRRPADATGSGRWRQPSAPCAASRSHSACWCLMAARRAPTSAGTARTQSRAPNAGPHPVRRDAHTPRRLPALPSQAPGNRPLTERRPGGWAACWNRQGGPGNKPRPCRRRTRHLWVWSPSSGPASPRAAASTCSVSFSGLLAATSVRLPRTATHTLSRGSNRMPHRGNLARSLRVSSAARALSSGMASPYLLRASLLCQHRPEEPGPLGNGQTTLSGVPPMP
jgi:hypothetical protein